MRPICFGFILLLPLLISGQQLLSNPKCNHWPDRGTCEHGFDVKWYYDRYDHRCRRFFYGGCEGNENRFDTLEECTSQCHFEEPSNRDRCLQPHDPGHCNADIERWFFDQEKKQCVCSWWSGCGGNSNIYYSYNHCMLICGDYAEHGPGIDEKYWGRLNRSSMSIDSQRIFENPQIYGQENRQDPYSVKVPMDTIVTHPKMIHNENLVTINISHGDDGPRYLHAAPLETVPFLSRSVAKSDGVTIHRYDSEPRLLQEIQEKSEWKIEEKLPIHEHGKFKRRFKVHRKKTPPRMILLKQPNQENAYKMHVDQGDESPKVNYQIYRTSESHNQISESLQNEAVETQRRIQEEIRRRHFEQWKRQQYEASISRKQSQSVPTTTKTTSPENYHPEIVQQFKSHLDDHEKALRAKLEAQFPDHVITLTPHIETIRHPDGRNVVKQRIEWTAHPKSMFQTTTTIRPMTIEVPAEPYPSDPFTTTSPVTTTMSTNEINRKLQEDYQKQLELRRIEIERRRKEHEKKLQEHQENQKREHEKMLAERKRLEEEQRQKFEEMMKRRSEMVQFTTTPVPLTTIVTTSVYDQSRTVRPEAYPTVTVQKLVYDADVQSPKPTSRGTAESIEHYRPLIEHVTSAPFSIEDIIAMDNQQSDYDDDYDVPMDFPETEAPATTKPPLPPPPPPPRNLPTYPSTRQPAASNLSPIVMPPTSQPKKSKLFAPISSEEYTQDIDFDPYVDFVM